MPFSAAEIANRLTRVSELDAKEPLITGAASTITKQNLTPNQLLSINAEGKVAEAGFSLQDMQDLPKTLLEQENNTEKQVFKREYLPEHLDFGTIYTTTDENTVAEIIPLDSKYIPEFSAEKITEGTLSGQVVANTSAVAAIEVPQVRNIYMGTASMTAGTTALSSGSIYFVYS